MLKLSKSCMLPAAVWVFSASVSRSYNPHTFQTAQKTWERQIPQHVCLYGSNRVTPTVKCGLSHGISDFHLHLLFWCSVSMADHRNHTAQLHPTQMKHASVIISNHFHMHIPQKLHNIQMEIVYSIKKKINKWGKKKEIIFFLCVNQLYRLTWCRMW